MRLSLLYLITEGIDYKIPSLLSYYYKGKDEEASTKEIRTIAEYDPTSTYKYISWLITNYQNESIILPEDGEKIKLQLKTYNAYGGEKPSIQDLSPGELYEFTQKLSAPSNRELKRGGRHGELVLPSGAELVLDNGKYQVVKITDKHAASLLASGTNWCVANRITAGAYLKLGPLYLIYENKERKYLVHYGDNKEDGWHTQVNNTRNEVAQMPLWLELIEMLTPISGWSIMDSPGLALKGAWVTVRANGPIDADDPIDDADDPIDANNDAANNMKPIDHKILQRLKPAIVRSVAACVQYATHVAKGRWPEGEPTIMKDPAAAGEYAAEIIKGRWPEAEPIIMKDPRWAGEYANFTIKGRWPEAEPIIMKDPHAAYLYAYDIIKGRWPEAEPTIMKDPRSASGYARYIKGRWPEAESTIAKDPIAAEQYAHYITKSRWLEAEPIIIKDPHSASQYAYYVIKGRWPEAEPTIMKNAFAAYNYAQHIIKGRWSEAEPIIIKDPLTAYWYAKDVIKGRWPEVEPIIAKSGSRIDYNNQFGTQLRHPDD